MGDVWTMSSKTKKRLLPYLMLSPFLILIIVFYLIPAILTGVMAFTDMDYLMEWNFAGIQNLIKIMKDFHIQEIFINTIKYVASVLSINVIFSLFLAILITYYIKNDKISMLFRTIWMLPRMSPPIVYVLLWSSFFDASGYGIINILRKTIFGLGSKSWLVDNAFGIVVLLNGMVGASFGLTIFSSAIKSIPEDLFKAAKVDGASDWSIVKNIILPMIKWPVMFVTIWQCLSLMTSYEYILLLTNGGPMYDTTVWSLYSYINAFSNLEFGYGAALAFILVIVSLVIVLIMMKLFGFEEMIQTSKSE